MKEQAFLRSWIWAVWGFFIMFVLYVIAQWEQFWQNAWSFFVAVITPFAIAIACAYILHPVVERLERRRCPRGVAILLIFVCLGLSVVVLTRHVVPLLTDQWGELQEHVPQMMQRMQLFFQSLYENEAIPETLRHGLVQTMTSFEGRLSRMMTSVLEQAANMVNMVLIVLLIPVLVFYFLRDGQQLMQAGLSRLPSSVADRLHGMLRQLDVHMGQYVRGQLWIACAVGLLAYIGYMLIGMPYAVLLAVIVAGANVIPLIGPALGAIPALLVAAFGSASFFWWTLSINIAVQLIENHVLSPILIGKSVHVHPLVVMAVLFVGGEIAGIIGLLLAMPVFLFGIVVWKQVRAWNMPFADAMHSGRRNDFDSGG